MAVDVSSRIVIRRPRDHVAAYAAHPDHATAWYANIKHMQWETPARLAAGSRVTFIAEFMQRRLEYTYEITDYVPGQRLVMRTAQGPFPMETSYTWDDTPDGGTQMTLRNRGIPAGFSKALAPFMALMIRRENRKDLRRLKSILEAGSAGAAGGRPESGAGSQGAMT